MAANYFKLIAYKDEYEVARMLTAPAFLAAVNAQVPGGRKLNYKLHPPALKALGRKKKISMGPRSHFALRLLARGKFLRGKVIDPFGHSRMRRLERRLITHYEATIDAVTSALTTATYDHAVDVASAPDLVRGYEEVKLRTLSAYKDRLAELGVDVTMLSCERPDRASLSAQSQVR